VCCSVFQCVAVCCSVLQCVAVCCSVLQYDVKSWRERDLCTKVKMEEASASALNVIRWHEGL